MSLLKKSTPVVQAVRRIATSEIQQSSQSAKFLKLKAKQEKFQVADGTLVHVKGGIGDKILYQGTMGLCILGIGMVLKLIYELSVPKK